MISYHLKTKERNIPIIDVYIQLGEIDSKIVLGPLYDLILAQVPDHNKIITDFDFLIRLKEHFINQDKFTIHEYL